MSKVVIGIGASHTTLMNTQWQRVDHLPRAHSFAKLGAGFRRAETGAPGRRHHRGVKSFSRILA